MRIESRCETHLKRISELLPLLHDALEKGSPRGSTNAPPGMEQARAYRQERIERDQPRWSQFAYLPETPTPLDLDVAMAVNDMRVLLASSHHFAMELVGLPRPCSRCHHDVVSHEGARGRCAECRSCESYRLALAPADSKSWLALIYSDARVAPALEPTLKKVIHIMEVALDLVSSGKLIMVRCPWCRGKTEAMPNGSLSLRVYVPGTAPETYVICTNSACEPPEADCGERFRGKPMWPFSDLDWLGKRLDHELQLTREEREMALQLLDSKAAA